MASPIVAAPLKLGLSLSLMVLSMQKDWGPCVVGLESLINLCRLSLRHCLGQIYFEGLGLNQLL